MTIEQIAEQRSAEPVLANFEAAVSIAATGEWECSNSEYHQDAAISHSSLEVFRRWSPTFAARYVFKTEPKPEPSDEMKLGSAFHCLLLEPDNFKTEYIVSPKFDRRTKVGKAAAEDFEAAALGKAVLDADSMGAVFAMLASARNNADVMAFLDAPQRREVSFRAVDITTGILTKARPDILADETKDHYMRLVDIKSNKDPCNWLRDAGNYGYHRQMEHYKKVVAAALNLDYYPEFFHVVVGTSAPYPVIVYKLSERSQALGQRQNRATLELLAECIATNDWRDQRQIGVVDGDIPSYHFPRETY